MTESDPGAAPLNPAIVVPEVQCPVWFLGALVRVRPSGRDTH